ncbi:MAG: response regulator [Prevotellaceae bacterium]|nr:response regulator [Prevotellaceae bacterium]
MNEPVIANLILLLAIVLIMILARTLYMRNQRLKEKAKMSMLFTNITHELLTPMTIISASVEHLKEVEPKHEMEYALMELNIQRSVRLLQQILETSKSNEGRLKLLVSNGDVMAYIKETARCIVPLMTQKKMQFNVTCSPESMMGWIDTDKIDKIIFNLLSNAVKYTNREDGRIDLTVKTNSYYDQIIIEVKDNGCGIPAKRQKHLFELFYDGDYRRFNAMGTGVGLSLTRDLVYLIGGTISYKSKENEGTSFIVTLPIGKEAFEPSQIDEKNRININIPQSAIFDFSPQSLVEAADDILNSDSVADDDSNKILIVDDNNELLMLMKQLLKSKYHVLTANNGLKALEIIKNNDLDLIVSDLMMPEMDGWELTEKIKTNKDYSHLPIILLTARTQEEDKRKSLVIGADEYMCKPFKMSELTLRIKNIIENRNRIRRDFTSKSIEEVERPASNIASIDNELLQKAIECMRQHLGDSEYNRDNFAADMGMSASSLYNKLRSITGLSVSSFMRDIRMKEACRIAREHPNIRISELAYKVGYKDPKYFATTFKKDVGMQPTEYIETIRESDK